MSESGRLILPAYAVAWAVVGSPESSARSEPCDRPKAAAAIERLTFSSDDGAVTAEMAENSEALTVHDNSGKKQPVVVGTKVYRPECLCLARDAALAAVATDRVVSVVRLGGRPAHLHKLRLGGPV